MLADVRPVAQITVPATLSRTRTRWEQAMNVLLQKNINNSALGQHKSPGVSEFRCKPVVARLIAD